MAQYNQEHMHMHRVENDTTAVPGREASFKKIIDAGAAIADIRRVWNAYLQSITQESTEPLRHVSTDLGRCLKIVHEELESINRRLVALCRRGFDLEPLSEETVYRNLLNTRQSTETIAWRLKREMPALADWFEEMKSLLVKTEKLFSRRINTWDRFQQDVLRVEQGPELARVIEFDELCKEYGEVDEADLARIRAFESAHELRVRTEAVQEHSVCRLFWMLSFRGVKMARQTLIEEYFKPV